MPLRAFVFKCQPYLLVRTAWTCFGRSLVASAVLFNVLWCTPLYTHKLGSAAGTRTRDGGGVPTTCI